MTPTKPDPRDRTGGAFRDSEHAWEFFSGAFKREQHKLVAIAQRALRRRAQIATPAEAEDLVHDALAHLVSHVRRGTADIRPDVGILVTQIRHEAQHLAEKRQRRRTYPHRFDHEPDSFDRTGPSPETDGAAITALVSASVEAAVPALTRRVAALIGDGRVDRRGWEALRTVELPEVDGPADAATRKRASRTRRRLWPAVAEWIEHALGADTPPYTAQRLSVILSATGIIRRPYEDLRELSAP